jgi:Bacterial fructose-1,6-bisphosphatase, glpX-encoded
MQPAGVVREPDRNLALELVRATEAAALAEPVDLVMGIGGSTEGILAAAAVKCLAGAIQARLWPRDERDRQRQQALGYPLGKILSTDDLIASDDVFVAITGVTSGALLRGVRHLADGAVTDSCNDQFGGPNGPQPEPSFWAACGWIGDSDQVCSLQGFLIWRRKSPQVVRLISGRLRLS